MHHFPICRSRKTQMRASSWCDRQRRDVVGSPRLPTVLLKRIQETLADGGQSVCETHVFSGSFQVPPEPTAASNEMFRLLERIEGQPESLCSKNSRYWANKVAYSRSDATGSALLARSSSVSVIFQLFRSFTSVICQFQQRDFLGAHRAPLIGLSRPNVDRQDADARHKWIACLLSGMCETGSFAHSLHGRIHGDPDNK
jgi:hypothetical protein